MHAAQMPLDWSASPPPANYPNMIEAREVPASCETTPTARVRARRTDPATSHQAAEGAAAFAGSHSDRILRALKAVPNATPHELTVPTRLTVVQIDRRLPELARREAARVVLVDGVELQRGGARVWEAC